MACGCVNPTFKEFQPLQSLLELSGEFALPTDIVEPDILLGIKLHVVEYPDYAARRFYLPSGDGSGVNKRYFAAGYIAFGIDQGYYMPEIPIAFDKNFYLIPPNCTHISHWFYPLVRCDFDAVIGTCPEEEPPLV